MCNREINRLKQNHVNNRSFWEHIFWADDVLPLEICDFFINDFLGRSIS